MRSTLCDAVARCHVRRLRRTFARAPLPALLAGIVCVLAPVAFFHVGRSVGVELAGAVGVRGVSDALVLGPVLAAAVAGGALAVSLPGRSAFGHQIAGAPLGSTIPVVAVILVPAAVGALVVLPSIVAACVALGSELPGGRVAGGALAVATLAAVPAGAIVAEGGVAAARSGGRRSLAILAGALMWAASGFAFGAAPLGLLAPVSDALRGSGSAWGALALACGVALALTLAWMPLAGTRPERCQPKMRTVRRLVRAGRLAIPTSLIALLARRSEVRLAAAGAVGFGVVGVALAVAAAARVPAPFLLGTTTALLGSILCPLVVCGVLLDGRWLWFGGARDRRTSVRAAGLVGLSGTALPVAVVGAGAAVASGASWSGLGVVGAYVVSGTAAALLAGAVIPWRATGAGDQFSSFAALAGVAIAMSLVVGLVAPRLVDLGIPDVVVVSIVCVTSVGVALHAVGCRLGADLP